MAESVQIAAFEGGQLSVFGQGERRGEAVLALPLSRLLVKMVRVPTESRDDPVAVATPVLQALSPYPDEPLTVGCEPVREDAAGLVVLAAALPESATDDIAEALDAAKLNVTRVDARALGTLREKWGEIAANGAAARRLVLVREPDDLALFVLDGEQPSAVRALSSESELRRELMLSLLEAEDFGGAKKLDEIVLVGDIAADGLEAFAPVRRLAPPPVESVAGLVERAQEADTLDALPASWREVLEETRFKSKLVKSLVAAGVVWALLLLVLFGVPVVYGFLTNHQKTLSAEHARKYREVKEMRDKVELMQKYSDHSRGVLEILKAVSDRLPGGVELNSWNFRREEGVKFSGEANEAAEVYALKDALIATEAFADVVLTGPSAGKGGKQRFDIECKFETEEE
ncbi:MAG: PilN domain-containing protein [Kiritimatiellae bacterium]|nr:PilN domain-containing protein [Kiritimatiellia bacterium]